MESHSEIMERAAEAAGGRPELTRRTGLVPSTITEVINHERRLSPRMAAAIEIATDGEVTREECLPEIFGELPSRTELPDGAWDWLMGHYTAAEKVRRKLAGYRRRSKAKRASKRLAAGRKSKEAA